MRLPRHTRTYFASSTSSRRICIPYTRPAPEYSVPGGKEDAKYRSYHFISGNDSSLRPYHQDCSNIRHWRVSPERFLGQAIGLLPIISVVNPMDHTMSRLAIINLRNLLYPTKLSKFQSTKATLIFDMLQFELLESAKTSSAKCQDRCAVAPVPERAFPGTTYFSLLL